MNDKVIEFRVATTYSEVAVKSTASLLRNEGIEIYEGRKTEIVDDSDNSIVHEFAIICCGGTVDKYEIFKYKYQYKEKIYEGFKTLY